MRPDSPAKLPRADLEGVLELLGRPAHLRLLRQLRRGIEKESLRIAPDGTLAATPHPPALGSALTNPHITTDFSEALLELVTPPLMRLSALEKTLRDLHGFVLRRIGDELLWAASMPCQLPADEEAIPIARYGRSNVARMKEIYRRGLGYRYGRRMQTIAGIHFNWSAPDELLCLVQSARGQREEFAEFKTAAYFGLVRNFRRHLWLPLYLLGAAPVVCRSFVAGRDHPLEPLGEDAHSLHAPFATSLRMGELGYQSSAQETLAICYNDLASYAHSLLAGLSTPWPPYERIGLFDERGEYKQLNTHLLQIENEFYAAIRPKRTTLSGEAPLKALRERGVEYVEVRALDVDPFEPLGVSRQTLEFLDVFLLHCLLADSPPCDERERREIAANQRTAVWRGREPGVELVRCGRALSLRRWGEALLAEMAPIAELLDRAHHHRRHSAALAEMAARLAEPERTPSARAVGGAARRRRELFPMVSGTEPPPQGGAAHRAGWTPRRRPSTPSWPPCRWPTRKPSSAPTTAPSRSTWPPTTPSTAHEPFGPRLPVGRRSRRPGGGGSPPTSSRGRSGKGACRTPWPGACACTA
ncbi:MAG: glutamate--cysteine ligase [Porticoccaceae bacterium]|nr:MAG: glutamate--cysteine ligase [Porticoccaceae bacterium]